MLLPGGKGAFNASIYVVQSCPTDSKPLTIYLYLHSTAYARVLLGIKARLVSSQVRADVRYTSFM